MFIHFLRNIESLKRGGYDAGCPLLGDTPKPHSSYFLRREDLEPLKRGGYRSSFARFYKALRLKECRVPPAGFHQPQPLLHKKGLQTTPQTPRQSLARDLIDSESWLSPSRFWYDSQSFRPSGVSHGDDDYASRWSSFWGLCVAGNY